MPTQWEGASKGGVGDLWRRSGAAVLLKKNDTVRDWEDVGNRTYGNLS